MVGNIVVSVTILLSHNIVVQLLKYMESVQWFNVVVFILYSSQLQSEIQKLQVIKKKLQVELHNFEQTFVKTAGR